MPSYTAHGLILLAAALLSGCIVPERLLLAYIDSDHDGHYEAGFPGSRTWDPGYDCDDNDPAIHDDRPELCGDRVDNDCDGEVDEDGVGDIAVWYDLDKDGFGDPDAESTKCEPNADWVLNEEDCDDQNNSINPLMNERCDGIDEDCDGVIDNDAPETPWYRDADGDSFGSSVSVLQSCQAPEGYVPNPDDCDDEDPAVYPAADDAPYDGIDADCFRDSDYDVDGDGFFHASRGSTLVDCDDVEPSIHPGSPEIWYDGVDQDCNPDTEWDADRDGFSAAPMGDDCDDASPFIYPSAREVWYDRIDQDCDPATEWDQDGDGLTVAGAPEGSADDCNDQSAGVIGPTPWYDDDDRDGWGDLSQGVIACAGRSDQVARPGDCNDALFLVHPAAQEVCSPWDDDCDGLIDEDVGQLWYPDLDQDGHGDAEHEGTLSCAAPFASELSHDDCNDDDDEIHPGALEACDGRDNDCVGGTDFFDGRDLRVSRWIDDDGDGWGTGEPQLQCDGAPGFARQEGDCDDDQANVHPGAPEVCDGLDQDCDGDRLDDGRLTWWLDADRDGWGASSTTFCPGEVVDSNLWTNRSGDCDDGDAEIHPLAEELCQEPAIDDDCDPGTPEPLIRLAPDGDLDGFGDLLGAGELHCAGAPGWVENRLDCDDDDAQAYPRAPELCDEVDQDCDGDTTDDARAPWYLDSDEDGYGRQGAPLTVCQELLPAPGPWVLLGGDCDDDDAAISPGAAEVCDDPAVDNDCDRATPEPTVSRFPDTDGDGFGSAVAPPSEVCDGSAGWSDNRGDCDDRGAPDVYPGAFEACDDIDQDCDGGVADDGRRTWYHDFDGDGWGREGEGSPQTICWELLPRRLEWIRRGGDCDDQDNTISPGAAEVCDDPAVDNDCDAATLEPTVSRFPDTDGDGHGSELAPPSEVCDGAPGWVDNRGDCDDLDAPDVNPDAPELCDEVDQDCDGSVADDGRQTWYYDGDRDDWGREGPTPDGGVSPVTQCLSLFTTPRRWVEQGGDCDDGDSSVHPAAVEVCEMPAIDNDCDAGTPNGSAYIFSDVDGDGYGGVGSTAVEACPSLDQASVAGDCDDYDDEVYPGAADRCDEIDQDCDGDPLGGLGIRARIDVDHDGHGDIATSERQVCAEQLCTWDPLTGDVEDDHLVPPSAPCRTAVDLGLLDCDDEDSTVYEDAEEICDGKDNDCVRATVIDPQGVCDEPGNVATRYEWNGGIYQAREGFATWGDAEQWCREHGYHLWSPTTELDGELEPNHLSERGLPHDDWTYHTNIVSECPNGVDTDRWMTWDGERCLMLDDGLRLDLGLQIVAPVGQVVVVRLWTLTLTIFGTDIEFPYYEWLPGVRTDRAFVVCELN